MGLTVAVGLFAQNLLEADDEERSLLEAPFRLLNEVLAENGLPLHREPTQIASEELFERQMWGYNGLHALRRAAAYLSIKGELPPFTTYGAYSDDPVYIQFNLDHESSLSGDRTPGVFSFLRKKAKSPGFQHLVMHSDAEGFYVPQMFDRVIVDWNQPQRPELGMMVGSTAALMEECRLLATALEIPEGFDPESDEFLDLMDSPAIEGAPWQRLPVEAHTAANMIAACEASLKLSAAIQFC